MNKLKTNWTKVSFTLLMALALFPALSQAEEKSFVYDDHGKRDPFWSLVSSSGTIITYDKDLMVNDLTLEGITMGQNDENIAIINGRVVKTNDSIGEFVVKQITKSSVILLKGQEQFELKL